MNEYIKRASILERRATYQALFYLIIIASVLLHVIFKIDLRLFLEGTFVSVCIFMGIGFRHKSVKLHLIAAAALAWLCGYIGMMGYQGINLVYYLFHWVVYFLLTIMIKLLIERYETEQADTLSLVLTLSKTLDARDPYTASHSENVAHYAVMIAEKMRLSPRTCQNIYIGALLHDIGKIGVPEHILNKPGQLTAAEYKLIKDHPKRGYEMVNHITKFQKSGTLDIILYHHERYDGTGYPSGLKEHNIPLAARIVSVADSFDAMTSKRIYRNQPLTIDYVKNEMIQNSGTQFDPIIANALISLIEEGKIKFNQNQLWLAKN
jgi:putative nucleotidyltransferase with HDIG domain